MKKILDQSNKKLETICAVVVTYNRKKLLIECLEALLKQTRPLDGIYIIDNASTDGTPELLKEKGFIQELPPEELNEPWEKEFKKESLPIFYVRMHENTGGAGGFHEGVKRAYEKGYDWLWLMDDDVEAVKNGLEELLKFKHISSCIHPIKIFEDGSIFNWNGYICEKIGDFVHLEENFKDNEFCVVNYGCFEGMLISKKIIHKIGNPDPKFFIIGDDTYYGYLASKYTNVVYVKHVALVKKIKKQIKKPNKLTLYLINRNLTYVFLKISQYKKFTLILRFYKALKNVIKYKTLVPLEGFMDGLKEKWGKEKKYLGK